MMTPFPVEEETPLMSGLLFLLLLRCSLLLPALGLSAAAAAAAAD